MVPLNTSKTISPATHLIAGIGLFLAGAVAWVFVDPYLPASLSNTQKGYQAGFTTARTLVENSSSGSFFRVENDVRFVSGTVTAIEGNHFSIHSELANNPFDKSAINDRTVLIGDSTKIVKIAASATNTTQTQKSSHVVVIAATSSDIRVGDLVTVTAAENIKTLTEFTATEIQVLPAKLAR